VKKTTKPRSFAACRTSSTCAQYASTGFRAEENGLLPLTSVRTPSGFPEEL